MNTYYCEETDGGGRIIVWPITFRAVNLKDAKKRAQMRRYYTNSVLRLGIKINNERVSNPICFKKGKRWRNYET